MYVLGQYTTFDVKHWFPSLYQKKGKNLISNRKMCLWIVPQTQFFKHCWSLYYNWRVLLCINSSSRHPPHPQQSN